MTAASRYREEDDSDTSCSSSDHDDEPSEECEDDRCNGPQPPVWHCVDCDSSYCSDCWGRQGPHKPKKKGRDGVPHEKTNPHVVKRLRSILSPTRNPDEIQRLHEDDESTKWFGVARDFTGRPNFEDYGRYATLMSSISPIESSANRYPQVVSFIGVTNAGKSTLIKMLINHDSQNANYENRSMFPSPVVGSVVNDALPTSGDVHLYADPATHAEQLPILYADCEGFEGGERTPLGARARRRASTAEPELSRPGNVYTRSIDWADTEEARQREYAVTRLYPRLLYTFSDCVVFVLRNPKTFQSAVLTKLLDWGASSLEKSINQPALPHCIVALNGTDPGVDDKEWDVNYATQSLLSSVKTALDSIEGVPRFRELAEHWRSLGKHIYTVEDLILRYYSSFKVVRIPAKPRYTTIDEQVGKLQQIIKSNCEESFRSKRRARMLTNAEELNTYLQSGFDHFTRHLDIPFNFMQISLLRNPIPNDFGGHILQLCTTISSRQPNHQHGRISWIFEKMSVMLASCVLLDCARFRKGRVDELFSNYEKFFDWAMGEYLELHYPCSFISADGTRQCMLVKARHQPKGHQDETGIIAAGDYQAAFDSSFLPQWKAQLRAAIGNIHRDFQYELEQASHTMDSSTIPEERIALDLHIEYLNQFFEAVGPASSMCSHATCFCCLMDVPEHPLACGHVLCTACIKAYGKQSKSSVQVSCCPLHRESTNWAKPTIIKFKPAGASVRILSLDGGGIRGIVQLEVLRAIERALGGHLPIQSFFDLMMGTGTGGLIAVALSLRNRTIDSIIDMFAALCDHAFTPRLAGVPIINQIAQVLGNGPRYKTKPLISALKTAFTDDDDLFGVNEKLRNNTRVALTATSATGQETTLMASYRRPEDLKPSYAFERPHDPEMELKTYEAIAASLASPALFKPFVFHGKTYLDGGLRNPNPALIADRERRLIWPDVGEPDMFLSLGTGQNRITVLQKLSDRQKAAAIAAMPAAPPQSPTKKPSTRWRTKRTDDVLEAELAWQQFRHHVVRDRAEAKGRRFIRFNPDLDREPPAADSKSELLSLQINVRKRLQTAHRQAALRNVAHRLVASSFYLELQSKATAEKSEQICTGAIHCRFEDGSVEMRALGRVLLETRDEDFEPYFLVRPDVDQTDFQFKFSLTEGIIKGMTEDAFFSLPNVYIPLRNESKATTINLFLSRHDGLEPDGFPISGFPRVILGEPKLANPRKPVRGSAEQQVGNPAVRNLRSSDGDSISLNGTTLPATNRNSNEDTWTGGQAEKAERSERAGVPKMALADLISQHQSGDGGSIKQRTNRFWTYIGNNHMAHHPEMYTREELEKQGLPTVSPDQPVELPAEMPPSPKEVTALPSLRSKYAFPKPPQGVHDSEADAKMANEMDFHHSYYSDPRDESRSQTDLSEQPTSPKPSTSSVSTVHSNSQLPSSNASKRTDIPSMCETEFFEEDDDWISAYSGEEVSLAKASPVLQLPSSYAILGGRPLADSSPLESAIATSLPDENTASALDRWLAAQKSSSSSSRKGERLKVVQEEVDE